MVGEREKLRAALEAALAELTLLHDYHERRGWNSTVTVQRVEEAMRIIKAALK